jgi:hypothetical protein
MLRLAQRGEDALSQSLRAAHAAEVSVSGTDRERGSHTDGCVGVRGDDDIEIAVCGTKYRWTTRLREVRVEPIGREVRARVHAHRCEQCSKVTTRC